MLALCRPAHISRGTMVGQKSLCLRTLLFCHLHSQQSAQSIMGATEIVRSNILENISRGKPS